MIIQRILPSLKYYLAHELYEMGCAQELIAKKLATSQANVSYYLRDKRVKSKVKIPREIIRNIAMELKNSKNNIYDILCKYCDLLVAINAINKK